MSVFRGVRFIAVCHTWIDSWTLRPSLICPDSLYAMLSTIRLKKAWKKFFHALKPFWAKVTVENLIDKRRLPMSVLNFLLWILVRLGMFDITYFLAKIQYLYLKKSDERTTLQVLKNKNKPYYYGSTFWCSCRTISSSVSKARKSNLHPDIGQFGKRFTNAC